MSAEITVAIERLAHAADLPLPERASEEAAAVDLLAALPTNEPLEIPAGERALVPTGLRIALPSGFEAQIRPRSGLAWNSGITVLNAPGTIDGDYRGEIGVVLVNLGGAPFSIERGMRIAQLVVAPVMRVVWQERPVGLHESDRGGRGFGSTGLGRSPSAGIEHRGEQ